MIKSLSTFLVAVLACSGVLAQPPVRKFDAPGAPPFKASKVGENPPLDAYDNFVIGPQYVGRRNGRKLMASPRGR